ncbi:PREDICTED: arrestin homolog isoform X2 [Polistes dominula]|uniref:Arrestin homolog isoform X2 n=1 Tax=Polistes dominula TaxID=743375 RepID=A0ABM1IRB2_POLDO|nr:PREDICTED: arrestin homolog isoform X2 [Polistes dominula]
MAENGNCRVQVEIGEVSHNVDVQLHSTENEMTSEVKGKRCQMQMKQVTSDLSKEDEICVAPIEEQKQEQKQEQQEEKIEKRILQMQQQQQQQVQQNNSQNYSTTTTLTATTDIQQIDKVYKKSSQNGKITVYLANRDLIVSEAKIDKLQGVLLVDPEYLQEKRVYGQITLTFRYGREDEEVMGLKFCNEAVMCVAQLYPPYSGADYHEIVAPFQEALIKKLGPNAYPFTMKLAPVAPPSVQLVPAKEYTGAPIGTSYDIRVYMADRPEDKLHEKSTIRMGIRVIQRTTKPPLPCLTMYSVPASRIIPKIQTCKMRSSFSTNEIVDEVENIVPQAAIEKPFLLSDGHVGLEARLDRAIYTHDDSITVHVNVNNNSSKSIRRIKVFVVQHVDVCMFSNGKFKNVVALISSKEGCPIGPGSSLKKSYTLKPIKGSSKNWIALEDGNSRIGGTLASTIVCPGNGPEDRNVFAIYVSYYVKVKLIISTIGGDVSLKLPFTLTDTTTDPDIVEYPSPIREFSKPLRKMEDINEHPDKYDCNQTKNKESILKTIEKTNKQSRITDVDLIEQCEEEDST